MYAKDKIIKTTSPTAILLGKMLSRHPYLPQQEVAKKAGLSSSGNILTLFKNGKSKLPLSRIPGICQVLGEDPKPLFNSALKEYHPEIIEQLQDCYNLKID
jgi:hypothetical protein